MSHTPYELGISDHGSGILRASTRARFYAIGGASQTAWLAGWDYADGLSTASASRDAAVAAAVASIGNAALITCLNLTTLGKVNDAIIAESAAELQAALDPTMFAALTAAINVSGAPAVLLSLGLLD